MATQTMSKSVFSTIAVFATLLSVTIQSGWAQGNPHAYFEELSALPQAIHAYGLRDQAQLDAYTHGKGASTDVTYRPERDTYGRKQDAAKIVFPEGRNSIKPQVRFPMNIRSGTALFTWDAWWGSEFQNGKDGLLRHKTFMISSPLDNSSRWLMVMTRYRDAAPPAIARADIEMSAREYGPGTYEGREETMMPLLNNFQIAPETWTRFWVQVELRYPDFDRISMWMADETRDPVQIYDGLLVKSAGWINGFWLEYNSSQSRRTSGELVTYFRNLVVLHNFTNPTRILRKPQGSNGVVGTTRLSAPKNVRAVAPRAR
jgi:hypothetical protein